MDQPAPGVGAMCGPCPDGYFGDGKKCIGESVLLFVMILLILLCCVCLLCLHCFTNSYMLNTPL